MLIHRYHLDKSSQVVEIASNDGYLLQFFKPFGIPVLGIEPAQNITEIANAKNITTICEFFSLASAQKLRKAGTLADVVIGNNVLAHVSDLHGFVQGIAEILKDEGVAVLEFPYVGNMVALTEFDTIYHEHLCYFSLTAVCQLFQSNGLAVVDVERLEIHGGSLRIHVMHQQPHLRYSDSVKQLLEAEQAAGVNQLDYYKNFAVNVRQVAARFREMLQKLRSSGCRIAGYGAAAKACTLLHFSGVGAETIEFIVDRNPMKQGLLTAGTRIPIVSVDRLAIDCPDALVIFPWNIKTEIITLLREQGLTAVKFIVPLPEPRIIQ